MERYGKESNNGKTSDFRQARPRPPRAPQPPHRAERTGRSKTEIVITALSGYLGANDGEDLGNRFTRLEKNMAELLTVVKDLKGEQN